MTPLRRRARIARLCHPGFTLGPLYLLYVPSRTIVDNDAAATAARVLSHETLFRRGMLAETLGAFKRRRVENHADKAESRRNQHQSHHLPRRRPFHIPE